MDTTGSAQPARQGRPRGKGKLAPYQAFLIARVEAQPDITMPELARALQAECGVIASPASLARVLCTAGFTYKKTTPAKLAGMSAAPVRPNRRPGHGGSGCAGSGRGACGRGGGATPSRWPG